MDRQRRKTCANSEHSGRKRNEPRTKTLESVFCVTESLEDAFEFSSKNEIASRYLYLKSLITRCFPSLISNAPKKKKKEKKK